MDSDVTMLLGPWQYSRIIGVEPQVAFPCHQATGALQTPSNRAVANINGPCEGVVTSRIACESLESFGLPTGSFVHLIPEARTERIICDSAVWCPSIGMMEGGCERVSNHVPSRSVFSSHREFDRDTSSRFHPAASEQETSRSVEANTFELYGANQRHYRQQRPYTSTSDDLI